MLTSAYYAWLANKKERDKREQGYADIIKRIFEKSKKTYGIDRICGCLRRMGYTASYKRVKRIVERLGIVSVHRRRRQRSLTDSRKARGPGYPNLVRNLDITEPFKVISSDISYIRTSEGFEYLCTVRDVSSGMVLAYTMANNMKAEIVEKTIIKAIKRWRLPAGCILHSDRGSNLKKEAVHWRHFQTRAEARQAIFAYIEGFYNTRRVQKRLGYLSPLEWLNQHTELTLAGVA